MNPCKIITKINSSHLSAQTNIHTVIVHYSTFKTHYLTAGG